MIATHSASLTRMNQDLAHSKINDFIGVVTPHLNKILHYYPELFLGSWVRYRQINLCRLAGLAAYPASPYCLSLYAITMSAFG